MVYEGRIFIVLMKKYYYILIALALVTIFLAYEYESTKFGFVPTNQTNLMIPTYDNSYQAMHPDVWYNPSGWNAWTYWMVMTPFTSSNDIVENPSLVVSYDGLIWQNAPNISNPLDYASSSEKHNCDPDLVYNSSSNELYIYYLDSMNEGLGTDHLKLVKYNGTGNTEPKVIRSAPNYYMVSPTVVYNDGYKMWMVNTTNAEGVRSKTKYVEYFTSRDGEVWTGPINTTGLELTRHGHAVWHINVQWIPSHREYWMILMAYADTKSGTGKLFFAKSGDGINWSCYNAPFMSKDTTGTYTYKIIKHLAKKVGITIETKNNYWNLYRTTFYYDATSDLLKIWYSAKMKNNEWYIYYTEVNYADFSNTLEKRELKMKFFQSLSSFFKL